MRNIVALALMVVVAAAAATSGYFYGVRTTVCFKPAVEAVSIYYKGSEVTGEVVDAEIPAAGCFYFYDTGIRFKVVDERVERVGVYLRITLVNESELVSWSVAAMLVSDGVLLSNASSSEFFISGVPELILYLEYPAVEECSLYLNLTTYESYFPSKPAVISALNMTIDVVILYEKPYS